MDIYNLMPAEARPKTIKVSKKWDLSDILSLVNDADIHFPFIVKPDIGLKALGVDKIECPEELIVYMGKSPRDFLIQELVPYSQEIGVFYARHPDESRGKITGIVRKEYLSVTGDGESTVLELIKKNPRSHLQLDVLTKQYGQDLNRILPADDHFILVPFGSHTRGAKFTDESHRITPELLDIVDGICTSIPGFYYGRLDILFNSFEELNEGRNYRIVEINGAGSEATHIYDPGHSLLFAWKEIIRHWKILFEISRANKRRGHRYLSFKEGRAMLRANSQLEAELKSI